MDSNVSKIVICHDDDYGGMRPNVSRIWIAIYHDVDYGGRRNYAGGRTYAGHTHATIWAFDACDVCDDGVLFEAMTVVRIHVRSLPLAAALPRADVCLQTCSCSGFAKPIHNLKGCTDMDQTANEHCQGTLRTYKAAEGDSHSDYPGASRRKKKSPHLYLQLDLQAELPPNVVGDKGEPPDKTDSRERRKNDCGAILVEPAPPSEDAIGHYSQSLQLSLGTALGETVPDRFERNNMELVEETVEEEDEEWLMKVIINDKGKFTTE